MPRPSLLGLACAAALASAPSLAIVPVVTDLGADNYVQAVSDDGAVVVGIQVRFDVDPAGNGVTRWTAAGGTRVIGGLASGRPDVSADGRTIGATVMADRPIAAFWTEAGGWKTLAEQEMIPPLPGWETHANAISANGTRLTGFTVPSPVDYYQYRGFSYNPDDAIDRWVDFGWAELPMLRKGTYSEATDTSTDGLVQVGISTTGFSSAYHAVIWEQGDIRQLRDAAGIALDAGTLRCNADCSVIAGGGGGYSAFEPVLAWRYLRSERGDRVCHFNPHQGVNRTALRYQSYATSASGNVIAGSYYFDDVPPGGGWARNVAKGFLWIGTETGGTMHDLQTYLRGLGQRALDGWPEVEVTGMSANGRYLVGWGIDASETVRGWRIDFGATPRATGPRADYTSCPPRTKPPRTQTLAAADAPAPDQARFVDQPSGEFGTGRSQRYFVEPHGARLLGGARRDRLQALLPLGGGRYLDRSSGMLIAFTRDREGVVTDLHARRGTAGAGLRLPRKPD